jgi:hypothetical protein
MPPALFLNLTRPTLDSLDKGMRKNADGSVDIYFGPQAPASQEHPNGLTRVKILEATGEGADLAVAEKSNWIYTPAEKSWFPWFRF